MGKIKVQKNVGGIEGLCVIEPKVFGDSRGYFVETYNKNDMLEEGLDLEFVQDNQSSSSKGVLRGLHFQKQYPQGKLVRVTRGRVFDVAVDLRKESKTYGKWFGVELSADNFIFRKDSHMDFWCCQSRQSFVINARTFIIRMMREVWHGMIRKSV